jgi:hypothetical protein
MRHERQDLTEKRGLNSYNSIKDFEFVSKNGVAGLQVQSAFGELPMAFESEARTLYLRADLPMGIRDICDRHYVDGVSRNPSTGQDGVTSSGEDSGLYGAVRPQTYN